MTLRGDGECCVVVIRVSVKIGLILTGEWSLIMRASALRWMALIGFNVIVLSVLGFHQANVAAQKKGQLPFSNSVEQRSAMIQELRDIKALLKEQNQLLRNLPGRNAADEKKRQ